ncbi:hypothetical protein B9Z48_09245 [Limnohabitans sp. WS1]|nr:hypothetical protein B9Z48_09245 [Limnohabitans sp. WS1]
MTLLTGVVGPAPGAMGGGPQGFIAARAPLLQFLWEPRPRGDGWWSARLHRGEGANPTKTVHANIIGPDYPVRSFKGTMTIN